MSEVVQFWYDGKYRKGKDFKIVTHTVPDEIGEQRRRKFVEFTVVGKNNEWTAAEPSKEFRKLNKHIEL